MQLHLLFYPFLDVYQEVQSNLWSLPFAFQFYSLQILSQVIDQTSLKRVQYHLNHHHLKINLNHSVLLLVLSKLFLLNFVDQDLIHYHLQFPSNCPFHSQVPYHFGVDYLIHQIFPNLIISYFRFLVVYLLFQPSMVIEILLVIFIRSSILGFLLLMFEEYKLATGYSVLFRSKSLC